MSSTSPLGVLHAGSAGVEPMIRAAGPVTSAPTQWSAARFTAATEENPDFSEAALLAGLNRGLAAGLQTQSLGFGSFSTGGDVCPSILPTSQLGQLGLGNSWYALSFSLGARANYVQVPYGLPGSSLRSLDEIPGAVLSYYVEGSTGISADLVGTTAVEQTVAQIGLPAGAGAAVSGIDWGMGAISSDPLGQRSSLLSPVRDSFYFTFSRDWLGDPNNPNNPNQPFVVGFNELYYMQGAEIMSAPINAATIYVMKWAANGSTLEWSAPEEAFPASELFGSSWGISSPEEIDALSVYVRNTSIARVVFSTTPASSSADQVLAYDRQSWAAQVGAIDMALPLATPSGNLVSTEMGFASSVDDVRGLCGKDPEAGVFDGASGLPTAFPGLVQGPPLGLSVHRAMEIHSSGVSVDTMHLQVTGLDFDAAGGTVVFAYGFPPYGFPPGLLPVSSWSQLVVLPVVGPATAANFALPGDLLGFTIEMHLTALVESNSSPTNLRSSWVSAIMY